MIYKCEIYDERKEIDGMFYDDERKTLIIEKDFDAEKIGLYLCGEENERRLMCRCPENLNILIRKNGYLKYITSDMIEDADIWEGFINDGKMLFSICNGMLFNKNTALCLLKKRIKEGKLDLGTTGRLKEIKDKFGMVIYSSLRIVGGKDEIKTIVCDNRTGSAAFLDCGEMRNLERVIMENWETNDKRKGIRFNFSEEQKKTVMVFCEGNPELYKIPEDFDMNHVMEVEYADRNGKIRIKK